MKGANSPENLFKEFDKSGKEDWVKKAQEDLKGESFDSLLWKSPENLDIWPFYTAEDTAGLEYLENYQHCFANEGDPVFGPPRRWANYQLINALDTARANKTGLNALEMGADGVLFKINNSPPSPETGALLDGILLEYCHVSFQSGESIIPFIRDYIMHPEKSGYDPERINGFYAHDAIAAWTTGGDLPDNYFKELASLYKQSAHYPNFKPLTVSSHALEQSGSGLVQELAFTLNTAVDYIDQLTDAGLTVKEVMAGLQFSLSAGSDFFMEIAKFRALRILFHKIALAYGLEEFHPGEIKIHGIPAYWDKTLLDSNNNMLRNTIAATAAIIAGCDSIQVPPHDELVKDGSTSSQRIARNVSSILREEAYLDKVVDPAAGSYYIETLTHKFTLEAWDLFRNVEKSGGFIKAFQEGKIQKAISSSRTQKLARVANRESVIVGINQYPDKNEQLKAPKNMQEITPGNKNPDYDLLVPHRAGEQFEALRIKTLRSTGQRAKESVPKVFVARLGTSSIQKARVNFIDTFFICAGFEIVISSGGQGFSECIEEAAAADEAVVVICGSNEDYREKGLDFVHQFKLKAPDKMLWLAGMIDNREDFLQTGLDGFIHLTTDVIATVRQIHRFLGLNKGEEMKLS